MSIMVLGGSEAKWISITLFRANVLKTEPCFWFLYMFSVQPRNRNRKADSEIVRNRKVQALQIGKGSASGENQIQRVTSDIDRHLTCCVKLRQSASDKNSLANEDLLELA